MGAAILARLGKGLPVGLKWSESRDFAAQRGRRKRQDWLRAAVLFRRVVFEAPARGRRLAACCAGTCAGRIQDALDDAA